jgi:hypothetical protein
MAYKASFRPIERLVAGNWEPMPDDLPEAGASPLPAAAPDAPPAPSPDA